MSDTIDLGVALDQVIAGLAAEYPDFRTVAAEDESRSELRVPAVIVDFTEIEPDPDREPHTGQFPCMIRVEARIVLGHRTPKVRREVIKAAGALAAFVHNNRFGIKWGAATVIAVEPDEFAPQIDTFDIWRVEWTHSCDLGQSYFVDSGITPSIVLTSWVPDIGLPNEALYVEEDV
jgi:hypothetical protein